MAGNVLNEPRSLQDLAREKTEEILHEKPLTEWNILFTDFYENRIATKIYNVRTNRPDMLLTKLCRIEFFSELDLSHTLRYLASNTSTAIISLINPRNGFQLNKKLTHLNLSCKASYDVSWTRSIVNYYPNLTCLKLIGRILTRGDFGAICRNLTSLRQLDISETHVPTITKMKLMKNLEFLIMRNIQSCPKESWINLGSAPKLKYLDISQQKSHNHLSPDVTEDFESSESFLPKLEILDCSHTRVTKLCLDKLKRRHPNLKKVVVLEVANLEPNKIPDLELMNTATPEQSLKAMKHYTLTRHVDNVRIVLRDLYEVHLEVDSDELSEKYQLDCFLWIHRVMDEFSDDDDIMHRCVSMWSRLASYEKVHKTDTKLLVNHLLFAMYKLQSETPESIDYELWSTILFSEGSEAFKKENIFFCSKAAIQISSQWVKSQNFPRLMDLCLKDVEPATRVFMYCTRNLKKHQENMPLEESKLRTLVHQLYDLLKEYNKEIDKSHDEYQNISIIFIMLMIRSVDLRKELLIIGAIEELFNHLRIMRTDEFMRNVIEREDLVPELQRKVTYMIKLISTLPDITVLNGNTFNIQLLTEIMNDESTDSKMAWDVASICSTYAISRELSDSTFDENYWIMIESLNARARRRYNNFSINVCNVNAYLENNSILQNIFNKSSHTGVIFWAMEVILVLLWRRKNIKKTLLPLVLFFERDDDLLFNMKRCVLLTAYELAEQQK